MRPKSLPPLLPFAPFLLATLCACSPRAAPSPGPAGSSGGWDVVVEDARFARGTDALAGSIFLPRGAGPRPAVALVLGSGAQDRTYGGYGRAIARHFARNGFVCLTWDKPGVGRSTGDFNEQSFRDRADEALAALHTLRERADVRPDQVGLWGHSQGGMVVPIAASLSDRVAFVIQVSGWQGAAWRQDAVRVEEELRAAGFPEADVKEGSAFARDRMGLIRGGGPFEDLDEAQARVKGRPWFGSVHWCDRTLFDSARRNVEFDTGPVWEKVRCPVLAIYGDKDTSSGPADELVATIRRGLMKGGNDDLTVRLFAGANHSLCRAEVGRRKGAAPRPKPPPEGGEGMDFVAGYLDAMTAWLGQKFGTDSSPNR
jgi:uncharacterized protein